MGGNWRLWLFRSLIAAAAVVAVVSFTMPWWIGKVVEGNNYIYIYGWGLRHNLVSLASYVAGDVTPLWQTVLAWVYVGVSVVLALLSTWLGKRKGSLLLGIIGAGVILYAFVAVHMVITNRLSYFGIPLEGFAYFGGGTQSVSIYAQLQLEYNLAYIAGGIWIGLSLLRGLIVGSKVKLNKPKEKLSKACL